MMATDLFVIANVKQLRT